MWDSIRALVAGGTTVLLTTQYLDEADRLADRIVVIDSGRAVRRKEISRPMTEYAGKGDARRSMQLLWGKAPAPTRGPKSALSLDEVVRAAVDLADAEGLAAISMRRLAERLGRSAMALYTYVPGKAELLDLMLDQVYAETVREYPRDDGWRAAVEAWARDMWGFYERHPWVLQVAGSRAGLGPNEFAAYETEMRLVDGLGLSPADMVRAVGVLVSFVHGAAKAVSDARAAEQATGMTDDEWWTSRAPLLEELGGDIWPDRYPTLTRLADEGAFAQFNRAEDTPYTVQEALDVFEFGLQRLLDGLEAYVQRQQEDGQA